MIDAGGEYLEGRALVLAPTARDAVASQNLLADAGVRCTICATIADVCREVGRGAGAALVTAEAVVGDTQRLLAELLRSQPPWSDLPLIVLTPPGDDSPRLLRALEAVGSMTLMKRPVQVSTLVSAVRSALRDRKRQYAVREFLDERERYRVTLSSIGDAVIATDKEGLVTFLNPVAEELTRWDEAAARGRPLEEVFRIVDEATREAVPNPAKKALAHGVIVGLANPTILLARDGTERPLDDSAAPICGRAGEVVGAVLVFRDITERKYAEEARERLANSLRLAVDAADLGTWEWNPYTDDMVLSARAGQIYGVDPGQTHRREHLRATLHPAYRDRARDEAVRAMAERTDYDIEYLLVTGRWVAARGRGVYGADGILLLMIGVIQDVTVRKRAEAALRESEERHRILVNATSDVVYRMNADWTEMQPLDGRHLIASNAAPIRDWIDKNIPPSDHARVRTAIAIAIAGKRTFELEHRVNRADGTLGWTVSRAVPILDGAGEIVDWFGTARDVTERKRAEEDLVRVTAKSERHKRLFETALSNTPDLIFVFGLDRRFTYANKSLLAIWGRTWDEAIGKNCLQLGYPDWQAARHDGEVDRVVATGQAIHGEVPFDGTHGRRVYDYIFAPVFGDGGEVEAVAGTARDTTDRKAMEESLRDSDRKKDDFIALLAHELRNPLAPVRNGLQVIRLSKDRATRERSQQMMDRQLTHMVRLIDDLLDVSRIGRNKMELRRARVAVAEVVNSAVETARPAIESADHELILELPAHPVFLDADLTRLSQVLSNLLTNSAKYTERGGRIWLTAELRDGTIVVTVRDNGIGIPAESLPRIFDMFSQVDRSVERNTGGLGIGLALVKGLVEMHAGTVSARSDGQGRGSEFTVTLPALAVEPVAPEPTRDSPHARACVKRSVLVVDDNVDGAESLAMMLELIGNEVAIAHDGIAAIEQAERIRPEIILMDVGMPKLDGLDATRRIREQPWGRSVTVIALTGWGQDADRERTREAGCDGHLVKPVNLPDLEKVLAELRVGRVTESASGKGRG